MSGTSTRVVWITGAGSGIGRASALAAASAGFRVVLSGRREEQLRETAALVGANGGISLVMPLDVSDRDQVIAVHDAIRGEWGEVTDLVYAAGLNTPRRYWRDQSMSDFSKILQVNLEGVASIVDCILPGLRNDSRGGTVVLVSSYSGWQFSPHAGVAYSAAKTALSSLVQTINAQEAAHGVRASNICPGDVDSEFLSMRPSVPDETARRLMLQPDDVARAIRFILESPGHVCIDELVITPTASR